MNRPNINKDLSRRNFLFQGGKSLALLASANVGVYVIGSAFKELDGSLVAGAKCDGSHFAGEMCYYGCGPGKNKCGMWSCVAGNWNCGGNLGPCGENLPCYQEL